MMGSRSRLPRGVIIIIIISRSRRAKKKNPASRTFPLRATHAAQGEGGRKE